MGAHGFDRTRVMTIALHPHVIGVAHRMESFAAVMAELADHPEVAFATSTEIGDWFMAQRPARRAAEADASSGTCLCRKRTLPSPRAR